MVALKGGWHAAFAAAFAALALVMALAAVTTTYNWRYEMLDDKMGIQPLCTDVTSRGGMAPPDCIEGIPAVGAGSGDPRWDLGYLSRGDLSPYLTRGELGYFKSKGGMWTTQLDDVDGLPPAKYMYPEYPPDPNWSGEVYPDNCKQTCYMCTVNIIYGDSCWDCGCWVHWNYPF